jgi:hypothetical protein
VVEQLAQQQAGRLVVMHVLSQASDALQQGSSRAQMSQQQGTAE